MPIINNDTNPTLLSEWPHRDTSLKYRPTPIISQELLDNARVIHGIISVPNRIDLKRNQTFNEKYEEYLKSLDLNAENTSVLLKDMVKVEEQAPHVDSNDSGENNQNKKEQVPTTSPQQDEQATESTNQVDESSVNTNGEKKVDDNVNK